MLKELRCIRIWPCFLATSSRIGINGFRSLGYHEKNASIEPQLSLPNVEAGHNYVNTSIEKPAKSFSSYEVFNMFAPVDPLLGCSRILSKDCFDMWVATRKKGVKNPEHSFRKALIAHCKYYIFSIL